MMALWFAVENANLDGVDAAVFAADVTAAPVVHATDRPSWADVVNQENADDSII